MNWLKVNFEWIFSGIGVFILGLILTFFRRSKRDHPVKQKQKSGDHSTNIQVGGDVKK